MSSFHFSLEQVFERWGNYIHFCIAASLSQILTQSICEPHFIVIPCLYNANMYFFLAILHKVYQQSMETVSHLIAQNQAIINMDL